MKRLLDAIETYKKLRKTGYFFALTYSKKGKILYDTNLFIKFDKENFRHLILGTDHLENDNDIEKNSKILFDEFAKLNINTCMNNPNFKKIITDKKYSTIIDRLENIAKLDTLLFDKNIKIYQKSNSKNVIKTKIKFDFVIKLSKYDNHTEDPFLFLSREHENSIICNPVSTFRSNEAYEQNHNFKKISSLEITTNIYKNKP